MDACATDAMKKANMKIVVLAQVQVFLGLQTRQLFPAPQFYTDKILWKKHLSKSERRKGGICAFLSLLLRSSILLCRL